MNQDNKTERYVSFFAEGAGKEAEEDAFRRAWLYLQEAQPAVIYHYAHHERTWWKKLQSRYPHICTPEEVALLFNPLRMIDLYTEIVRKVTEWPTIDQSLKTLAKSAGFKWRDTHPSGAASIQWFDEWVNTGDQKIKQRVLDYNEDDCVATRWVLDAIRSAPLYIVEDAQKAG